MLHLGDYWTAWDTADGRVRPDPLEPAALYRSTEGLGPAYRLLNGTNYLDRQVYNPLTIKR